MAVLALPEAEAGLRAGTVVALTGFEPVPALVRTTRIKLRLLTERGWALESTPGLFTIAPGPASLLGVPEAKTGHTTTASQSAAMRIVSALVDRIAIERAKGMLAQDGVLTVEQAYHCLQNHSARIGRSPTDLARALVKGDVTTADLIGLTKPEAHERQPGAGACAISGPSKPEPC